MIFRAAPRPCFPKVPERPFVRAGADFAREGDFPATLPQGDFTTDLRVIPASPKSRAGREDHLSIAETKMRQCSSSEVFRAQ